MRNIAMDYNYDEQDGAFIDKEGNPITNGIFKAIQCKKVKYGTETSRTVEVEFIVGTEREIIEIPFKALESNKLCQYIPEHFFFYKDIGKFKEKFIRERIQLDLKDLPINEFYALEQGDNIIEGKHIFCIGDCIVNPSNDIKYVSLSHKKLKPSTDKKQYLKWIDKFFDLDEDNMPVLLLSVIVAIIQPLLQKAGINDLFVTYIYGETGKGKSTYAKLLTEIYDNAQNYLTFSSDITGIRELMSQTKDFVMLTDDFNKSSSSRTMASKEAKISEIIQQAANGDKVQCKGKESYLEGIMFVTAEEVIKNASTINRCILVNIKNDMNTKDLKSLQDNKGLYIGFIKCFIKYIYNNFENNVKWIKEYNNQIEMEESVNDDAFAGIMRIKRTEKTLKLALGIMINFFVKSFCKKRVYSLKNSQYRSYDILDKLKIENINNKSKYSIENCINNTKKYVKKEDKQTGREYIDKIINLLMPDENDTNSLPFDSPYYTEDYEEYIERKQNDPHCILFKDGNCICFAGKDIKSYFESLDDFNYRITKQAISEQLKYHGLLKCQFGEYSFPCKSAKNKQRYYHIDIKKLAEFEYPEENESKDRKKFIKLLEFKYN